MLEGLWTATFASDIDGFGEGSPSDGSGIVIFERNRIFGGDAFYYYTGNYEMVAENRFKGLLHVTRYIDNARSIFGNLSEFDLDFIAEINDKEIIATGFLVQFKTATFAAKLIKRADLPE